MGPNRQRDRVSPDAVRLLPVGLPDHDVGAAVRGVLPAVDSVVGRRRRHPAHRGRPRVVVAGRRIPPHAGHRLRRDALRLRSPQGSLHRLCARSRWLPGRQRCGRRSTRHRRERLRRNRIGTTRRRPPGGALPAAPSGPSFDSFESALSSSIGAYTASQSSSSSGGGVAAVASAAAVAVAAAEEEADHGEIPADRRVGAGGAGADRFRDGLQQDSRAPTCGSPKRCPASTSS